MAINQTLVAARQRYYKLRCLMAEPPEQYVLYPKNGDEDAPRMHIPASAVALLLELECIEAKEWLNEVKKDVSEEDCDDVDSCAA